MGDRQIAETLRRLLFFFLPFFYCAGRWYDNGLYLFCLMIY
jgi:hypothetical protein